MNLELFRLDADSQWWRSEIIFPWRDQFERATPIDLHFVDPMPPRDAWRSHAAHIIVTQAVPVDHVAILLTTVFSSRSRRHHLSTGLYHESIFLGCRIFLDRQRSSNPGPSSGVASRGRLVFPHDRTARIGNGDSIVLRVDAAMPSQAFDASGSFQHASSVGDGIDLSFRHAEGQSDELDVDDEVDVSMLMQSSSGFKSFHWVI